MKLFFTCVNMIFCQQTHRTSRDVYIFCTKMFHHPVSSAMSCGNVCFLSYSKHLFNMDIVFWKVLKRCPLLLVFPPHHIAWSRIFPVCSNYGGIWSISPQKQPHIIQCLVVHLLGIRYFSFLPYILNKAWLNFTSTSIFEACMVIFDIWYYNQHLLVLCTYTLM